MSDGNRNTEQDSREEIDRLKAKFRACFSNREYAYCIELLNKMLPIIQGKDKTNVALMLGICNFKLRRYQEAINVFEGIKDDLPSSMVFFPLGQCYSALKINDEAEKYLEKTVEIDPNVPEFVEWLGYFYLAVDKKKKALELYHRLKTLDKDKAYKFYDSILESDPDNTLNIV